MAIPKPEYVLDLAERLKIAKQQYEELQDEWNSLFKEQLRPTLLEQVAGAEQLDLAGNSLRENILAIFNNYYPTMDFSVDDIVHRLTELGEKPNRNSVGVILSKLVSDGSLEKRGTRKYGLKSDAKHDDAGWKGSAK